MQLKVIWTRSARFQLKDACDYIKKDSLTNSEKVRKKILAASMSLSSQPKKHPLDKYKINNDGSYRTFIVYRYRISYRIQESEITILRMRHTSMEPMKY
jgi:plasmid stabilization system protein ParE